MTQGIEGLLGNNQQGLAGLTGNPLFGVGMNLLASRYNPQINPFGAVMSGLASAGKAQDTAKDREIAEQQRQATEEMRRKMLEFMQRNPYGQPQPPAGPVMPQASPVNPANPNMSLDPQSYLRELELMFSLQRNS